MAAAYAKTLTYYADRSGDTEAAAAAKKLLDGMWDNHQDALGIAVPENRADYNRFDDPVHIPSGWTGTMPNGDAINSSSTFDSIRSFYEDDPAWSKIESLSLGRCGAVVHVPPVLGSGGHRPGHGLVRGASRIAPAGRSAGARDRSAGRMWLVALTQQSRISMQPRAPEKVRPKLRVRGLVT